MAFFLTDPLVISCTAHKNMFLLRAFQDIRLTARFVQFCATLVKYFVALLQAHMGQNVPWKVNLPAVCRQTQAQVPSRAVGVRLSLGVSLSRAARKWEQFNPQGSERVTVVVRDLRSKLGCSCLQLSRGSSWIWLLWLQGLLWTVLLLSRSLPSSHANTCCGHS